MKELFYLNAWAAIILLMEAAYESNNGDKRHWTSVLITFIIYSIPLAAVQCDFKYILPYFAVRCFFDLAYNYFSGNEWHYLGETARTDKFLKQFDQFKILLVRFVLFFILNILTFTL